MSAGGCTQLKEKGRGQEKGSELRMGLFHLKNCRSPAQRVLVAHPRGMRAGWGQREQLPREV